MIRQFDSWLEDMHPISYSLRTVLSAGFAYLSSVLRITATFSKIHVNKDHFVARLGTESEPNGRHHPFYIKAIHSKDR